MTPIVIDRRNARRSVTMGGANNSNGHTTLVNREHTLTNAMRYTAHFDSYEAGMVRACKHFASIADAVLAFRMAINEYSYYRLNLNAPDATMRLYPYNPDDTHDMCHGDYPIAMWAVGKVRRDGERTVRREYI